MKRSNAALASLLFGIGGLLLICVIPFMGGTFASLANSDQATGAGLIALLCAPVLGYLLALVAVITGIVGISQTGKGGMTGRGMAIFGIILGAGPFAVLFAGLCALIILGPTISNIFQNIISTLGPVGP